MKDFAFDLVGAPPPTEKNEVETLTSQRPSSDAKRGPPPCARAAEASRRTAGRSIGTVDLPMRITSREPRGARKERRRVLHVPESVKSSATGNERGARKAERPRVDPAPDRGRSPRRRPGSAEDPRF